LTCEEIGGLKDVGLPAKVGWWGNEILSSLVLALTSNLVAEAG
jgi:hypothetical protein